MGKTNMGEIGRSLLSSDEIARRVDRMAVEIAARIDDDWTVVCLLTGAIWFTADLTRALYRLGCDPGFDALWLASYGDARATSGEVVMRAGLQRPVVGRGVLIIDDVLESGLSLQAARRIVEAAGAREVLTSVFARKPWPAPREIDPDFVAWEAPAQFLAGYGMDGGGRHRGLPGVVALD